jgi:hypothetical protein
VAINEYQGRAKDPLPVVPANVDAAEVFFQHTPIADAKGSNHGVYNLWGQVPVRANPDVPVRYYNLTGIGISHGGDYSVPDWYQVHVVPTLGDGAAFTNPSLLTGGLEGGGSTTSYTDATYQGAAAPGARVDLLAVRRGSTSPISLGGTIANPSGNWSLTTRPLPDGTYRIVAQAVAAADPSWPHVFVTPKARLGTLRVAAGTSGSG